MSTVRRVFDLDADTDAQLKFLAAERGQDAADVVADAAALLVSAVEIEDLDAEEDLRRLREFERGEVITGEEMMAWVDSSGTDDERPPPRRARSDDSVFVGCAIGLSAHSRIFSSA